MIKLALNSASSTSFHQESTWRGKLICYNNCKRLFRWESIFFTLRNFCEDCVRFRYNLYPSMLILSLLLSNVFPSVLISSLLLSDHILDALFNLSSCTYPSVKSRSSFRVTCIDKGIVTYKINSAICVAMFNRQHQWGSVIKISVISLVIL